MKADPSAIEAISKAVELARSSHDEDQLFERIGYLDPDRIPVNPEDIRTIIVSGKAWWDLHSLEIKGVVCGAVEPKDFSTVLAKSMAEIVFPLLAAKYGEALSVYLAALAIKKMLEGWCAST